VTGGASSSSSSLSSPPESEDEGEDEDKDGDGDDPVACGSIGGGTLLTGVFSGTSDSPDEESDEDDAWRRLRFLLRLRGAAGILMGGVVLSMCSGRKPRVSMLDRSERGCETSIVTMEVCTER